MVFGHVASEDFHGANTKAQCKEGLIHGGHHYIAYSYLCSLLKIREQIKLNTFHSPRQSQTVDCQHHD